MLPPPVQNYPFLLAASKEFQTSGLERGHRQGSILANAMPTYRFGGFFKDS
jgi:hypothetical protein